MNNDQIRIRVQGNIVANVSRTLLGLIRKTVKPDDLVVNLTPEEGYKVVIAEYEAQLAIGKKREEMKWNKNSSE